MKKWLLAFLLLASPALAQEKFNLFTRAAAPGCATGYLLYVSAAPTIGCGSVTSVIGSGFVKLQNPGPGTAQTGGFYVNDSARVGLPLIVESATTGLLGTQTLAQFFANAPAVNTFHEISYGNVAGEGFNQWVWQPTSGNDYTMGWYKRGSTRESGIQFAYHLGVAGLCLGMDAVPSVYCQDGFSVGVISGHPGFGVDLNGDLHRIGGNTFSNWPGMQNSRILGTDGSGAWQWYVGTALGGGGTLTSLSTTLPVTGCSSPCTSTATVGLSVTTTNDGGAVAKQSSTPGTVQTGNANLSGTIIAGGFSGPLTGNVTGNVTGSAGSATTATTATTATKANALATTGASVDVSGSAAPSGSSQACVTTDATHCTWQTVTVAGGSGNVTVAAKGDIQTYTTAPANLAVGTNGQVPTADSTASSGLSYQWSGYGTLHTLKETVFAGITPAGYANGSTTTIDGSAYTATVPGNGAVDIVATGLRLRMGTTSGAAYAVMTVSAGATGDFNSFFTEERFRRGKSPWAVWVRTASYNYANTPAGTNLYGFSEFATTKWGMRFGRMRQILGTPNTTTGGLAYDYWWNGGVANLSSYSHIGVSSADVFCILYRTPVLADVYIGTYSGGWPTLSAMTKISTISYIGSTIVMTHGAYDLGSTNMHMAFLLGGGSATTGTYELIFDRWRVTAWE